MHWIRACAHLELALALAGGLVFGVGLLIWIILQHSVRHQKWP